MFLLIITLFPAIGALLVALYPESEEKEESMFIALGVSCVTLAGSIYLYATFLEELPLFQFGLPEPLKWIPSIGVSVQVGIDGISLLLYVLTAIITPLTILSANSHIKTRRSTFYSLLLLLESAMLGAFVSLDLFMFYVFWELMLIPMYFIIGVWGGPRRISAAVKFFIFTMAGSLPMFLAILYVYLKYHAQFVSGGADGYVLEWTKLAQLDLTLHEQCILFAAFALSFAIKVPMFPLHTWLPDAHVEAPTAGSIILAGILLKMGGYGFLRFGLPLFPEAAHLFSPYLIGLCIVGIIYGALVAMVQDDIKTLIAYSSVSHMAMVILGIFTLNMNGIQGGIYQMLAHGFSTGALFLLVGFIYDRRHTRLIEDYGGLGAVMPWYAAGFLVVTLASIGLPGTMGFIGEFLILVGAFQKNPWIAAAAGTGVILSAWYMLRMYRHVFHGPITNDQNRDLPDLSRMEIATLVPFVVFIVLMGVYPQPFLAKTEKSIARLVNNLQARAPKAEKQHPDEHIDEQPKKNQGGHASDFQSEEKAGVDAVRAVKEDAKVDILRFAENK